MITKKEILKILTTTTSNPREDYVGTYAKVFNEHPICVAIELGTPQLCRKYLMRLEDELGLTSYYTAYTNTRAGNMTLDDLYLMDTKRKIMVGNFGYRDTNAMLVHSAKTSQADIDKYIALTKGFRKPPPKRKTKGRIHILTERKVGKFMMPKFVPFKLAPFELSIEQNYTDDFMPKHQEIEKRLNMTGEKGIVVLYGDPGTGKTYYIRHLSKLLKKKILYVPPGMVHAIVNPAFIHILERHKNSILLIEDADNILRKRDEMMDSQNVSSILNLADGMLTDVLQIQIVATFNTTLSNIDPAFLRKGRLIAQHKFAELPKKKAQALSDYLGFESKITQPMTLTDIYNQDRPEMKVDDDVQIGFRKNGVNVE